MSELAKTLSNINTQSFKTNVCPVVRILNSLDEEDKTALTAVLSSTASTRSIHTALREVGHAIDRQSISLHRDQRCRCKWEGENK